MPVRPLPIPVRLGSVALRYRTALNRTVWRAPRRKRGSTSAPGVSAGNEDVKKLRRLEAVLFLAREPLSSRKLSQYATLDDGTEARALVKRLNSLYDQAGRAFKVAEIGGGFQLLTRSIFGKWLQRLPHVPNVLRLSTPAMETLAVVAYRQPVLRVEIEAIRGVSCGELLRQLMERDLVRIGGRSEELGRPYLYATTGRFLRLFGLRGLSDLPRADWVRNSAPPPEEEASEEQASEEETSEEETSEEETSEAVGIEEAEANSDEETSIAEKSDLQDEKTLMNAPSEDETSLAAVHPDEPPDETEES